MISSSKAALAFITGLAFSPAQAKVLEDTVATVNGTPIMLTEYQKELNSSLEYWSHTEPDAIKDPANLKKLKETTLEELINRELLYQEGSRLKIRVRERDIDNGVAEIKQRFAKDEAGKELSEADAEAAFARQLKSDGLSYEQFRERLSKQIMARKLIDEQVRAKVEPPPEKDVRAYFDRVAKYIASGSTETPKGMGEDEALAFRQIAQQVKTLSAERVRASRILIKLSPSPTEAEKKRALKTATELRKRLTDGTTTFPDLARAESEDSDSAPRGGDLGYILRGVTPPEFEKAVFSLPVGEISEPILTEGGYNIVRVSEKRAAEAPDFERLKDDLGKYLMNIKFQHSLEDFVKALKSKAVIERNLPTT